jgi:hypothetical protein
MELSPIENVKLNGFIPIAISIPLLSFKERG